MQERETKWTPMKALGRARKKAESLGIPIFSPDLAERENLNFSELDKYSDKELEGFLTMYGGYEAFLETKVATIEATLGALEASFNEGYSASLYKLGQKYEAEKKKKPTKDEIRGEIMTENKQLKQVKRDVIEQEAELRIVKGLLETYRKAYGTVSRVVTLRTKGAQD